MTIRVFLLLVTFAVCHRHGAAAQEYTSAELRHLLVEGVSAGPSSGQLRERSIPLAFGLSAVVPGLGQAYNRQWIKAGIAAASETVLLVSYVGSRNRGVQGERDYMEYAHRYWHPEQYARYLNDFKDYLAQEGLAFVEAPDIEVPDGIDLRNPDGWSYQDSRAVRMFFDQIRAVEDEAVHPETGASFSHNLPYLGEQQYYELIGKYFQFAPGWVDYPAWRDAEGFTTAIDPEVSGPDGEKVSVKGRFWEYAEDHARSNDFLRTASRLSTLFILTHLAAAVDAAVFAKLHNDRLQTEVSYVPRSEGQGSVKAALRLRF